MTLLFAGRRARVIPSDTILASHNIGAPDSSAARAAIAYGFEQLGTPSIVATIRPGNNASIAVAGRLDMTQIAPTSDEHGELLQFRLDRQ